MNTGEVVQNVGVEFYFLLAILLVIYLAAKGKLSSIIKVLRGTKA